MGHTGGDSLERTARRVGLPGVIPSPATDGAIGTQPAGMDRTDGDSLERTLGRVGHPFGHTNSPAGDGAICAQPTRMEETNANGLERTFRRIALARIVGTPADDGVISAQPTRMFHIGGDCQQQIALGGGIHHICCDPSS